MGHNRRSKQSKKQITKDIVKDIDKQLDDHNTKPNKDKATDPIIEVTVHKGTGETIETNQDSKGNLVLTSEDKARIDSLKSLQAKANQAKIDAKDAKLKAEEALQALSGSEAIKTIKADIEKRLKDQEAIVSDLTDKRDKSLDKLREIQSEYQSLTGIDKAIKKTGKSKTGNGNGSGKFETTPITIDTDGALKILVTHKETKNLFEYSLYPSNGTVKDSDWKKLRHSCVAQFERETKEDNLTIRAYLSNLKGKIEAIKAIK